MLISPPTHPRGPCPLRLIIPSSFFGGRISHPATGSEHSTLTVCWSHSHTDVWAMCVCGVMIHQSLPLAFWPQFFFWGGIQNSSQGGAAFKSMALHKGGRETDIGPWPVITLQLTGVFCMGNAKGIPCSPIQVSGNTEPSEAASLTGEKWQIPLPGFHVSLHTKEAFFLKSKPKGDGKISINL